MLGLLVSWLLPARGFETLSARVARDAPLPLPDYSPNHSDANPPVLAADELPTTVKSSLPVDERSAQAQPQDGAQPAPAGQDDAGFFRGLRLAPIRFWGSVAYDLRLENVEQRQRTVQHLITTTLNATSYIWQPWFALVSAGLGVTAGRVDDHQLAGDDHFLTGYGRLNLFPQSRFPFETHYEVNDSRIGSGLGPSTDYRSTRFGVSQRYRPEEGGVQLLVSYDRSTQDASLTGRDIQDTFQFDAARSWQRQTAALNTSWSKNRRVDTDEDTLYRTIVGRHSYAPSANLSVETVANWTDSDFSLRLFDSETKFLQLSSVAFWRDPARPLTISGSGRLFTLHTDAGGQGTDAKQASSNLGAVYLVNKNLRLTGNLALTRTETGSESFNTNTESVGATYQGDTISIADASYDWFAGTDVSHTSGGGDGSASGAVVGTQLGHSLTRVFPLGENSRLSVSFGQNFSAQGGNIPNSELTSDKQIVHYGSITWNKLEADTATFVRLSASDSRFLDGREERFQLINLQATRTHELTQYSSWSGNLTIQSIRQRSELAGVSLTSDRGFVTVASADLTYQHQKTFGIPRLRFFSQLRVNRDETLQALGTPLEREQRSWENRLDYTIGRLESRLLFRLSEIDNERRYLLMWRLIRYFGD